LFIFLYETGSDFLSTRDLGDISFGFDFAATPAAKTPTARKSTTKTPRTHSSASIARQVSILEDRDASATASSQKRKRASVPLKEVEDELGEEESLFVSAKSRRITSPTGSAIENAPPSTGISKRQSLKARSTNPRTPLLPLDAANPQSSRSVISTATRRASRHTRSPLNPINEDQVDEIDDLSFENIEAIELPTYAVDDEPQETYIDLEDPTVATVNVTRPTETTFAPPLEGTRDVTLHITAAVEPRPSSVPAPSRPTYTRASQTKPKARRKPKTGKAKPSGQTVQVTVYRRSKKAVVDTDPLGAAPIPAVNPADVLLQIAKEMGNKHIEKTKENTGRREFEKKHRYPLLAFMANLEDLLGDVSRAQNDAYAMSSRIRSLKREQSDLRTDLMRIKKDREDVLFEIDSVRINRAARMKVEQQEHDLLNSLHDLDVAVQRGRSRTKGMKENELVFDENDMLLSDVKDILANGGLIGRCKDWNELLDQAASSLI